MWHILLWSLLFFGSVPEPALSEEHSLFYIYTALSKPLDLPGIYDFTAMGLLNDLTIDYYNSQSKMKIPKQSWMKDKMEEDYWEKGTQSRKSKEQWFKVNVDILIDRMRHNTSHLHVLQWRHGCVIDESSDGQITFMRGVDEYSYDGSEFLSFDDQNSRWIAPVQEAEPTKRKWDGVDILNQYTKSYLEKECVNWLTKFMYYGEESLRNHSQPEVHIFKRKSLKDTGSVILTCMATGYYPPDIELLVRKKGTYVPEHLVASSEPRPNGDGTYQLKKSVEVKEEEINCYDCYVKHLTLKEPIIKNFADCKPEPSNPNFAIIIAVIVIVLLVVVGVITVVIIKKRNRNDNPKGSGASNVEDNVEELFLMDKNGSGNDNPKGSGASNVKDNVEELFLMDKNGSDGKNNDDKDSGHGSRSSQETIDKTGQVKSEENSSPEDSRASSQQSISGDSV